MRVAESSRVAVDALRANRLRSALTMLGVVIGVAAVIVLVGIGAGAKSVVTSEVEGLGSNLVFVVPGSVSFGSAPSTSRLGLPDVTAVARALGDPRQVAATVTSNEQVAVHGASLASNVQGVTETVPYVFSRPLAEGRYLSAADVDARRRVAVLGADAASRLFGAVDPRGRVVTVAGVRFRVVGVFRRVGSTIGVNRDTEVHIPITTAQRLLGTARVDGIAARARSGGAAAALGRRIVAVLSARVPGQKFTALTQTQLLGTLGRVLTLLTVVLAAIAAISLLVGGVGVSNIMLVSVRERTREIGLRKAVGARQRDILGQFLVEAVLLTSLGGVAGVLVGVGGYLLISAFTPLPASVPLWAPIVAVAVSAGLGVAFGVVPARGAGRLPPVVALRAD